MRAWPHDVASRHTIRHFLMSSAAAGGGDREDDGHDATHREEHAHDARDCARGRAREQAQAVAARRHIGAVRQRHEARARLNGTRARPSRRRPRSSRFARGPRPRRGPRSRTALTRNASLRGACRLQRTSRRAAARSRARAPRAAVRAHRRPRAFAGNFAYSACPAPRAQWKGRGRAGPRRTDAWRWRPSKASRHARGAVACRARPARPSERARGATRRSVSARRGHRAVARARSHLVVRARVRVRGGKGRKVGDRLVHALGRDAVRGTARRGAAAVARAARRRELVARGRALEDAARRPFAQRKRLFALVFHHVAPVRAPAQLPRDSARRWQRARRRLPDGHRRRGVHAERRLSKGRAPRADLARRQPRRGPGEQLALRLPVRRGEPRDQLPFEALLFLGRRMSLRRTLRTAYQRMK